MGFKELKIIYETIIELSKANNISHKEAIEKFLGTFRFRINGN